MTRPARICAAIAACVASAASTQPMHQVIADVNTAGLTSFVRFTTPICADYPYSGGITSKSGDLLHSKPQHVYCLPRDEISSDVANGPRSEIKHLLSEKPISAATFALWVIDDGSDRSFSSAVCSASYATNSQLRFIYDARAPTSVSSEKTIDRIEACLKAKGQGPTIRRHPLGRTNGIGSMHNKNMIVDYTDGSTRMALSTGHYLFGTTIHFDSWVFISGASKNEFFRRHRCALDTIANHQFSLGPSYKEYFDCLRLQRLTSYDIASAPEYIFLQLPYQRKEFDEHFGTLLAEADEIDIAMSLFTARKFHTLILEAARRGVRVRLILDDDHYWASQGPDWCPTCYIDHSRVSNWTRELLDTPNVQVRFLETANQQCGGGNFLHKKDAIFKRKGAPKAVLTGSLNFTPGGIGINLESVYFVRNSEILQAFSLELDRLFQMGTPTEQLPSGRDPRPELPTSC